LKDNNHSITVAILGALKTGPMTSNEIKLFIDKEIGDWFTFETKAIFSGLTLLVKEGFLSTQEQNDSQNNSSHRRQYEITNQGKLEFTNLLHDIWIGHDRQQYSIDLAIYFQSHISNEQSIKYLENRIEEMEQSISYLQKTEPSVKTSSSISSNCIISHQIIHIKAEIAWMWDLLDSIKTPQV
jgi:DNA-binding PadR family transcriptional regulator